MDVNSGSSEKVDRTARMPLFVSGAFVLTPEIIKQIIELVTCFCGLKSLSAVTSDGATIEFRDTSDLLSFPNISTRKLDKISIDGYASSSDRLRSITVQIGSNTAPYVQGMCSGSEKDVLLFKRDFDEILLNVHPSWDWIYQGRRLFFVELISTLFYAVFWAVLVLLILDVVVNWVVVPFASNYYFTIVNILLWIVGLNFFRMILSSKMDRLINRLFPPVMILIGDAALRYEQLRSRRRSTVSVLLVGILLSLSVGVVASVLGNAVTPAILGE